MDKEDIFHLLDLTILNNFIVLASCGSKLSHQLFRWTLVRDLVQEVRRIPQLQTAKHEHQAPSTSQLKDLTQDTANTCLWEEREFGAMCVPLKTKIQVCIMQHAVCAVPYFEVYHTKLHF
jgi:hypothetical protein